MTKRKRSKKSALRRWGRVMAAVLVVAAVTVWFLFFRNMAAGKDSLVFIKDGDDLETVLNKVSAKSRGPQMWAFRMMAGLTGYGDRIQSGRYEVDGGALMVFRNFYHGHQAALHVTIPSVRTLGDLADAVCRKVQFKKADFMAAVTDSAFIDSLGYTPQTIIGAFTPNTYDIYWDITARDFVVKMARESDRFWTQERLDQAQADSLTRMQVITLASIVQEETNIAKDKPVIAGLYINRLRTGMPMQSCPTIRFALGDFTINRIYASMLQTDSPYNTYKNRGLPPGPIRNPNPEDIDAVLNYDHNDYLYMCASAKFDGTHHFTKTYEEHKAYSVEYDKELERRNIK